MNDILIVDELADVMASVRTAIQATFPHARCRTAHGAGQALALMATAPCELALVNLALANGSALSVVAQLAQRWPRCTVVVSSSHDDDEHLFQALQAGAHGYLLSGHPVDWLVQQLQGMAQGQPPLSPAVVQRLLRRCQWQARPSITQAPCDLSARECQVLSLLAQGIHIPAIGTALGISRHTASDHVKHIYRKLSIRSRAEAALHARSLGLA